MLEQIHGAVDVEVDSPPPGVGVDLRDRADGLRPARAVHDTVQPSVPRRRGLHRTGHLLLVGNVGGLGDHVAGFRFRLDLINGRRQALGVATEDHHLGTGLNEAGGHTLSDTAAASGDQIGPVGEREFHALLLVLQVLYCVARPGPRRELKHRGGTATRFHTSIGRHARGSVRESS